MCVCVCVTYLSGKLPIQVDDDDAQQVFTTTALELPQAEEETSRMDESTPPLPPKPLAE